MLNVPALDERNFVCVYVLIVRCKIVGHFIANGRIFYGEKGKSTENLLFENIYA